MKKFLVCNVLFSSDLVQVSNCLEKKGRFIYLAIGVTLKTTWADSCCPQQIFVVFFSPTDGEVSMEAWL